MGYDVGRFQGDVDEDLICPICSGVLEEPVQVGVGDEFKAFILRYVTEKPKFSLSKSISSFSKSCN